MLTTVVVATVGGACAALGGWMFEQARHVSDHFTHKVTKLEDRVNALENKPLEAKGCFPHV
jgi:hypothetical protein